MSFAIDANVLLYASDETSDVQRRAAEFLESCARGSEAFYLPWPVVMTYLRVITNPAVVPRPLSEEAAAANISALLAVPHGHAIGEEAGFWDVYREATRGLVVRGNFVPDAHIAAILRQHGIRRIYTRDRDFRKFDFLEVRDPLGKSG